MLVSLASFQMGLKMILRVLIAKQQTVYQYSDVSEFDEDVVVRLAAIVCRSCLNITSCNLPVLEANCLRSSNGTGRMYVGCRVESGNLQRLNV
jgi:hypothetical protein